MTQNRVTDELARELRSYGASAYPMENFRSSKALAIVEKHIPNPDGLGVDELLTDQELWDVRDSIDAGAEGPMYYPNELREEARG